MEHILDAARATGRVPLQSFGKWCIDEVDTPSTHSDVCGYPSFTRLKTPIKADWSTIHLMDDDGLVDDVVMEDTKRELQKHLQAMLLAKGHVLKTGLGLGCFVRGALAVGKADYITVVEIDPDICSVIGREFQGNPKVRIINADAFEWQPDAEFDFCWHDIWCPRNNGLAELHAKLMLKYEPVSKKQSAWNFPRYFMNIINTPTGQRR
jgi:hypothetical protein